MANFDVKTECMDAVRELMPELVAALTRAVQGVEQDRLLRMDEAAAVLGCSKAALQKRIERGSVRGVRVGHSLRIRRSDILTGGAK